MKRPYNKLGILWMTLAGTVLLAGIVSIGVPPASAAGYGTTCDIQSGSCLKETGDGMTVEFDIQPKPVVALSELTFIVNLTRGGMPVTDASVVLDLSMPGMFMGKNQPILKHAKNGRYEGKGVITRCPSGKKTWQADVTVGHDGKTAITSFVFEVK
jgi:hypothetical protein